MDGWIDVVQEIIGISIHSYINEMGDVGEMCMCDIFCKMQEEINAKNIAIQNMQEEINAKNIAIQNMQKEINTRNIAIQNMQKEINTRNIAIQAMEEKLSKARIVDDLSTPYGQTSLMNDEIK